MINVGSGSGNAVTKPIAGMPERSWYRHVEALCLGAACLMLLAACGASATAPATQGRTPAVLRVVAAENFWGSIAKQEGGNRAHVTSVIVNPNADPHAYEPTTSDARLVASAQDVIYNGVGYDPWMSKLLDANPVRGRRVLSAGDFVGKKEGDNPHLWYNPSYVVRIAAGITATYQSLDPRDATYFGHEHARFMNVSLKPYFQEITRIKQRYHGVPVGATESIFQYLARSLDLNLVTPYGFMKAISEGSEPTAQDKSTFDRQITDRQIKVFVFNSQNATPDTNALEAKARGDGIPVVPITETLQPASASFQAWQTAQLQALQAALHRATGR